MQQQKGHRDGQQLWAGLKKGDEAAFSELFLMYVDELYEHGYMLCRNKELVEDCIQDLFFRLWKKRAILSDVKNVRAYLLSALRNRIHDSFRKLKEAYFLDEQQEPALLSAGPSAEEDWIADESRSLQKEAAIRALHSLPERMRQAIKLRYFEGLEYEEIARAMNISKQVAINMVYRATQKLRAHSESYSRWMLLYLLLSSCAG
ncbi:MAG: RNA polymerase sigma factor [Phaeodactylibacter sp.]|nr:RNA polymerase sigma factor [Phaeodactylibacter sp.]